MSSSRRPRERSSVFSSGESGGVGERSNVRVDASRCVQRLARHRTKHPRRTVSTSHCNLQLRLEVPGVSGVLRRSRLRASQLSQRSPCAFANRSSHGTSQPLASSCVLHASHGPGTFFATLPPGPLMNMDTGHIRKQGSDLRTRRCQTTNTGESGVVGALVYSMAARRSRPASTATHHHRHRHPTGNLPMSLPCGRR